jgi:hypothetical protein
MEEFFIESPSPQAPPLAEDESFVFRSALFLYRILCNILFRKEQE